MVPAAAARRRVRLIAVAVALAVVFLAVAGTKVLLAGGGGGQTTRSEQVQAERAARDAPGSFRLSLSEDDLAQLIRHAARQSVAPVGDVDVRILPSSGEEPGSIVLTGQLSGSRLPFSGRLAARVADGRARLALREARVGWVPVPEAARSAVERLLQRAVDVESLLGAEVVVESVHAGDGRLTFEGMAEDPAALSEGRLRALLRDPGRAPAAPPPRERLGRGLVAARRSAGQPLYAALGDSLASGSGLADARDGYVSRLHRQLAARDGVDYGLANFAVGGETSASLLHGPQLREVLAFLRDHDVAYVTLDIGGNDLLHDLRSPACDDGVDSAACRVAVTRTFAAYEANLDEILRRLRAAEPHATVAFLQTYNAFNVGGGSDFERRTDEVTRDFNALAADVAARHGVLVADGFAAMAGTIPTTTGMGSEPPDIHPRPLGHDLLAAVLLDALDGETGEEAA